MIESGWRSNNRLQRAALLAAAEPERYGARIATVLTSLAAFLAISPTFAAEIGVHQLQSNQYELVLTNATTIDEKEARAYVAQVAASVCKDLTPVLGQYRFEAKEALGSDAKSHEQDAYRFVQEVTCVPTAGVEVTERRPILKTPQESSQAQEEIRRLSEMYLRHIADNQIDEAYSQVSIAGMGVDEAAWKSEKRSFQATAGKALEILVVKITVYNNPAEAPEPGLYIAADFNNVFENIPIHCGYLMWFRPIGGTFTITREETGYVTAEQLKSISNTQLPDLKRQLRCVAP